MWKYVKQKWKERKGFGSIEIVLSAMIVLMMVGGMLDMISITQRFETVSQATNYVSRIVQKQGGVRTSRIDNYNGKYTTSATLYNNVKDMMESNGIHEEDWTLTLTLPDGKSYTVTPTTNVPIVNYGQRMKVTISVNYRWNIVSTMLPIQGERTRDSIKEVLSGYQSRQTSDMKTTLGAES